MDVDQGAEVVARVAAAIDVAKATGMLSPRMPGITQSQQRDTGDRGMGGRPAAKATGELASRLVAKRIERSVQDSASDYWRTFVPHAALFDRGDDSDPTFRLSQRPDGVEGTLAMASPDRAGAP